MCNSVSLLAVLCYHSLTSAATTTWQHGTGKDKVSGERAPVFLTLQANTRRGRFEWTYHISGPNTSICVYSLLPCVQVPPRHHLQRDPRYIMGFWPHLDTHRGMSATVPAGAFLMGCLLPGQGGEEGKKDQIET